MMTCLSLPPAAASRVSPLVLLALLSACGGGGSPTPTQPSQAQVAGQWSIGVRINALTGGDCASAALQHEVGRLIVQTLTLQQDGATVSGRGPLTIYGVDCDFTGTAGPGSLSLRSSRCPPLLTPTLGMPITCATGAVRRLLSVSAATDVSLTGASTATGPYTETFVVTSATGEPLDPMVLSGTATLTRQ